MQTYCCPTFENTQRQCRTSVQLLLGRAVPDAGVDQVNTGLDVHAKTDVDGEVAWRGGHILH